MIINNIGYALSLLGMWTFCDSLVSIKLRWGKDDWGYHLVRVIRGLTGVALLGLGYYLIVLYVV